jgi:uncharacterized protein YfbU (UPF0304 family)
MTPKAERFEMRLDEDLLVRVDEWRAQQGSFVSRAEAIRRLVQQSLAKDIPELPRATVQFSDGEKLLLIMLRDIYKHLKITKGEIDAEFVSQVLWGGHYWALNWQMPGLYHGHEDKTRELDDVLDVLEMWDMLERAYSDFSKKTKDRIEQEAEPFGKAIQFRGFDGNHEPTYMGIADFLVNKMERFVRFKDRELNSHMPSLPIYRRMLSVYRPMRSDLAGRDLTADEVIAILKAKKASDGRAVTQ